VFAFFGTMGSGKTTFIKSICRQLGVNEGMSSPTFGLVNEYAGLSGHPVYHFDFYRIKDQQEAIDIGCEEYFYSGEYCFVEWPEKILNLLPKEIVRVCIEIPGNGYETRLITFQYE
jgi:tRNA threonylcarbamoyladenosine biosynthesis protein TsaE